MKKFSKYLKKTNAVIYGGVFAFIGVILLLVSHAAINVLAFETESGALSNGAVVVSDSTAASGAYVKLSSLLPTPTPSPTSTPNTGSASNNLDTIVYDLFGPPYRTDSYFQAPWGKHEAQLDINPGFDWADGARSTVNAWNVAKPNMTEWCEVVAQKGGPQASNFSLEIRNMKLYALIGSTWQIVDSSAQHAIGGFYGDSDFNGLAEVSPVSIGSDTYQIPWRANASLIHPWLSTWPRAATPSGYKAGFATAEMRITGDANAKVLGSCGWDWYNSGTETAAVAPGIGVSRHKFLTSEWKHFNLLSIPFEYPSSSMSLDYIRSQMASNLPPLN